MVGSIPIKLYSRNSVTGGIIVDDDDKLLFDWIIHLGHTNPNVGGGAPNHLRKMDGVFTPTGRHVIVVRRLVVPASNHRLNHRFTTGRK